jgi:TetR/AcrR family transcriptional regulator
MSKEVTTEQRILNAARCVFMRKGMAGARMQEVADQAGINKALLHYYFRSKQRLFEGVFKGTAKQGLGCAWQVLEDAETLFPAIHGFVGAYLEVMLADPLLPQFVIAELNRDPKGLLEFIDRGRAGRAHFIRLVEQARERDEIIEIDPRELLVNMMALCAHPFIARPMLTHIHGMNDAAFRRMVLERRRTVPEFIIRAIKK